VDDTARPGEKLIDLILDRAVRDQTVSGAAADRPTIDDASAQTRSAPVIPTSSPNELKAL